MAQLPLLAEAGKCYFEQRQDADISMNTFGDSICQSHLPGCVPEHTFRRRNFTFRENETDAGTVTRTLTPGSHGDPGELFKDIHGMCYYAVQFLLLVLRVSVVLSLFLCVWLALISRGISTRCQATANPHIVAHIGAAFINLLLFVTAILNIHSAMDCNGFMFFMDREHKRSEKHTWFTTLVYWPIVIGSFLSWIWPCTFVIQLYRDHIVGDTCDPFEFKGDQANLSILNLLGIAALVLSSFLFIADALVRTWYFASNAGRVMENALKGIETQGTQGNLENKWEDATNLLYLVHKNLTSFFSFNGGGKIWVHGLLSCVVMGSWALAFAVWQRVDKNHVEALVHFCGWAAAGFFLLTFLALISLAVLTDDIAKFAGEVIFVTEDRELGRNSIWRARERFYIATRDISLGVRFFGKRIDWGIVFEYFVKVMVAIPTAYKVYAKLVDDRHHMDERPSSFLNHSHTILL